MLRLREAVQQRVHQLALQEDRVGSRFLGCLVQLRVAVARQGYQAEGRVVSAEVRERRHAVDQRHVQVDHESVRPELLDQLDRREAITHGADHRELVLTVDEGAQALEEERVVVREQNSDSIAASDPRGHPWKLALPAVSMQPQQPVAVIGAPLDLGAGRRGVDMGPSAIRYAGLDARIQSLGRACEDCGNVDAPVPEATEMGDEHARFLPQILATCERVAQLVASAVSRGRVPLVLGGDHSVAIGTLGGLAKAQGPGGVLWIDAHGDLNTPETSPSGNVHGMALAAALGLAGDRFASELWPLPSVDRTRVALVGVRSLDEGERALLGDLGARVFTMSDVDRMGVEPAMRKALAHVEGPGFVHVSLDMDSVDPDVAPGVGTPVRGGLSYREAHLALELVAESGLAGSLEVTEVNPILDRENETGRLAVELVASALGARIL